MLKTTRQQWRYWTPPVIWATLIFMASSMPAPDTGMKIPFFDKIAHAGVFGILAVLIFRGLTFERRFNPRKAFLIALIATSLYGIMDETHQWFVPSRQTDIQDWIADSVGALLFLGMYAYMMVNQTLFKSKKM